MHDHSPSTTEDVGFAKMLSGLLRVFFWDALKISLKNPARALFFLKTVNRQAKAAGRRTRWRRQGFHVPPIAIFSVTNNCNLHCKGCYSWALHASNGTEMSTEELEGIFAEARDLGILFFVLAGGEPLVRSDLLEVISRYPEIIFLVFTNGLLLDSEMIAIVKMRKNIIPVLSLEGYQDETDGRRGEGVYQQLQVIIDRLKANNIFYSISITVTRLNFATVTDDSFIRGLVDLGCKLLFLLEYSPIQEGTENWVISAVQRAELISRVKSFRSNYRSLFISIPGDEEEIGGCLSAGRGFVHINASGDVEPCPFAPYSDTNLRDSSLKQALQSEFLKTIRQNRARLSEAEGGCALWVERAWVRSMLPR
jgi:MoaA/NifB/PqqE/SkfB family radical SAM enzyme